MKIIFFYRLRKYEKDNHNVYWWDLTNYKNNYKGSFSFVSYNVADCKAYGIKSFELVGMTKNGEKEMLCIREII